MTGGFMTYLCSGCTRRYLTADGCPLGLMCHPQVIAGFAVSVK
jgi:hypothetical protein